MSENKNAENIAKSLNVIIKGNYIIPIYQRNYNWGASEITQLMQDLYECYRNDPSQDYFFGNLVVFNRSDDQTLLEVIDGQQRLTTIHILFNLLLNNSDDIQALRYDSRPEVESFFSHLQTQKLVYKPTDVELSEANLINFLAAIETILKGKLIGDINDSTSLSSLIGENKHNDFLNYIVNKVILVEVLMPKDTDVASYFEIMNNRGKQLQEHEIIKAQLMSKIKNPDYQSVFGKVWDACSEMDRPIHKFFTSEERTLIFGEHYDQVIPRNIKKLSTKSSQVKGLSVLDILSNKKTDKLQKEKNNESEDELDENITYTAIIDFTNFLIHILKLVYPQADIPLSSDQLYKIYKNIPSDVLETVDPMQFLEKLFFYRVVFDRFIVKSMAGSENDDQFESDNNNDSRWALKKPVMYRKNARKYARYYNTLNFKNSFENNDFQERLVKLLSMLQVTYRQRKNKNYMQYILGLFDPKSPQSINMEADEFLFKVEEFTLMQFDKFSIMEHITEENSDEIVFDFESIYAEGTNTPHFIFNFIDYLLWVDQYWNKNAWGIDENFVFTYTNSIEHHFPQAQIAMLKGSDEEKKVLLHCLGNLCLISKGANSKLNDRSAWDKATDPRYSKGVLTPKRKIMYAITQQPEKWNREQIMAHYHKIVEILANRTQILNN